MFPRDNEDVYWSLLAPDAGVGKGPAEEFAAGMRREEAIEARVVVDTPDPWLNAAVGACSNVEDACFRDGIYTHSGMRWSKALLGWRTLFGGTVLGSHENVKTQAAYCIGKQIKESDLVSPKADARFGLSREAPDSRLFGKGRVDVFNPPHYDMQSQFFDQMEHAWRWTGDAELEKLLRPSLDLHCEYIKDCFDPAGLGIYESYANTWPTDDQWYNGGGTSRGNRLRLPGRAHGAATRPARGGRRPARNGTRPTSRASARGSSTCCGCRKRVTRARTGSRAGSSGCTRAAWLYAIFCPIDAGLLDSEQAAEALHYTEWALERDADALRRRTVLAVELGALHLVGAGDVAGGRLPSGAGVLSRPACPTTAGRCFAACSRSKCCLEGCPGTWGTRRAGRTSTIATACLRARWWRDSLATGRITRRSS